ncbi:MAG TPA: hypothetical protein VFR10_06950, partial [bacterium]|nr:hypothetical protein [bacterium]
MPRSSKYNRADVAGRGSAHNPRNRFERLEYSPDPDAIDPDARPLRTIYLRDDSRKIISWNDSPDVSFDAGLNPYRGCE